MSKLVVSGFRTDDIALTHDKNWSLTKRHLTLDLYRVVVEIVRQIGDAVRYFRPALHQVLVPPGSFGSGSRSGLAASL
jgi:hypothetical protein